MTKTESPIDLSLSEHLQTMIYVANTQLIPDSAIHDIQSQISTASENLDFDTAQTMAEKGKELIDARGELTQLATEFSHQANEILIKHGINPDTPINGIIYTSPLETNIQEKEVIEPSIEKAPKIIRKREIKKEKVDNQVHRVKEILDNDTLEICLTTRLHYQRGKIESKIFDGKSLDEVAKKNKWVSDVNIDTVLELSKGRLSESRQSKALSQKERITAQDKIKEAIVAMAGKEGRKGWNKIRTSHRETWKILYALMGEIGKDQKKASELASILFSDSQVIYVVNKGVLEDIAVS